MSKPQKQNEPAKKDDPAKDEQAPENSGASEPVTITFRKPYGRYVKGDVAGFDPEEAARLVAKNAAVEGTTLPAEKDAETDKEPKA